MSQVVVISSPQGAEAEILRRAALRDVRVYPSLDRFRDGQSWAPEALDEIGLFVVNGDMPGAMGRVARLRGLGPSFSASPFTQVPVIVTVARDRLSQEFLTLAREAGATQCVALEHDMARCAPRLIKAVQAVLPQAHQPKGGFPSPDAFV